VIATGGTNQVSLSWSAVNNATSYNVYYSTTAGVTKANGTKITNATSPAVQASLTAGTTYYYIVTALNGTGEGTASVQVAATTLVPTPAPTAPAAPTGVTAAGGTNLATISWTAASGATSYNLYWSTTSGVTKANGTKVAGVTSPYVKTGLSAGTTYYFIVTAANSIGESAASTQAFATTSAAPPAVPSAPTGVTATGGANQVSLAWPAVSGATSYNIYWSTTSGVTTSGTKITGATSPSVQTGLAAATAYYYIVTAVNSSGESVASAQVTAATNAAPAPTCGSCHAIPPATGQHSFHISLGYLCAICHGTGYTSTTVNAATHNNGVKNVVSNLGWNGTTCGTPGCHGSRAW
jgi:fibronectin type 3 domain-containing protein